MVFFALFGVHVMSEDHFIFSISVRKTSCPLHHIHTAQPPTLLFWLKLPPKAWSYTFKGLVYLYLDALPSHQIHYLFDLKLNSSLFFPRAEFSSYFVCV